MPGVGSELLAEVLGTGSLYMVSTCHTLYGQGVSVQSGQVRWRDMIDWVVFNLAWINLLIMVLLLLLPIKQNCSYFTLLVESMERVCLVAPSCTIGML